MKHITKHPRGWHMAAPKWRCPRCRRWARGPIQKCCLRCKRHERGYDDEDAALKPCCYCRDPEHTGEEHEEREVTRSEMAIDIGSPRDGQEVY